MESFDHSVRNDTLYISSVSAEQVALQEQALHEEQIQLKKLEVSLLLNFHWCNDQLCNANAHTEPFSWVDVGLGVMQVRSFSSCHSLEQVVFGVLKHRIQGGCLAVHYGVKHF